MRNLASTDAVPPQDRLDFWQEMVRDSYVSLEVEQHTEQNFFGSIDFEPLGLVDISELHSCSQRVWRTPQAIRHSDADFFFIVAQLEGTGVIAQDTHKTMLDVGRWALVDSTRPFEFSLEQYFKQLVVSIPRNTLPFLIKCSSDMTGQDLSRRLSLGGIVSNYLLSLSGQVHNISPESRTLMAESVINLLCAALNETLPDANNPHHSSTIYLEKIKNFILQHLRDPDLSVSLIASELDVSNRYVHKLFNPMNMTVSEYIRCLRLENCRRELISERNKDRSITHIAFSWGFNSAAHFSYLFRQHYGMSASEYRRQHLEGNSSLGRLLS